MCGAAVRGTPVLVVWTPVWDLSGSRQRQASIASNLNHSIATRESR